MRANTVRVRWMCGINHCGICRLVLILSVPSFTDRSFSRIFLPAHLVEHLIIHVLGFSFDLFVGFLILWKPLRSLGAILTLIFNGLNSRMFSIGMFPYVMIAMLPLFFEYDWPVELIERCLPSRKENVRKKRSDSPKRVGLTRC